METWEELKIWITGLGKTMNDWRKIGFHNNKQNNNKESRYGEKLKRGDAARRSFDSETQPSPIGKSYQLEQSTATQADNHAGCDQGGWYGEDCAEKEYS